MTKLSAFLPVLLLAACASSSPPPASSPSPASSSAAAGATEPQGEGKLAADVKSEVGAVDAALADLDKRLDAARDTVQARLRQQLVALQKRDDELKARFTSLGTRADAASNQARDEIHRALVDLRAEMNRLTERVQR